MSARSDRLAQTRAAVAGVLPHVAGEEAGVIGVTFVRVAEVLRAYIPDEEVLFAAALELSKHVVISPELSASLAALAEPAVCSGEEGMNPNV